MDQAVKMQKPFEEALISLPEVQLAFGRLGTAEVATDPMSPNQGDEFVILKPEKEWPNPKKPKAQLIEEVDEAVKQVVGTGVEIEQPVQLRANELISGVKSDMAVKIFGDDLELLRATAEKIRGVLVKIRGAVEPKVQQVEGLPLLTIQLKRDELARYGLSVGEVQRVVRDKVQIPPGYWLGWGGQFEQLQSATARLKMVVPLALALIFALLFMAFGNVKDSLLVYTGVPLALTGGILSLWLRGLPFSISAGVGFIALSGVAVLNGVVMVSFISRLRDEGHPLEEAIRLGTITRLRPVLMTALVASLGFLPMALAHGRGAEVQRPLATVVIGGIISSTALTLLVLPVLYRTFHRQQHERGKMELARDSTKAKRRALPAASTIS